MALYFRGERIRLRALERSDAEYLYHWEHNEDAWASSVMLNPLSSSFIEAYILEASNSIVLKGEMSLMIERCDDGMPIGYVQLLGYDAISRRVGLGLYIAQEYRRLGYAKEVVNLTQDYAFARLGVRMIYADILASNEPCCRLFESLGYTHTATLPQWHYAEGTYHDLRYYQLWSNQ